MKSNWSVRSLIANQTPKAVGNEDIMNLMKLLKNTDYRLLQGNLDKTINEIQTDSRKVGEKDLFICIKGAKSDGHAFVRKAISQGSKAILVEQIDEDLNAFEDVTIVQVSNSRKALATIAANFYDHPQNSLQLIGITGTKGKTTTAQMIAAILNQAGHSTGYIGTIGVSYQMIRRKTLNTTPDPLNLHRYLREMVDAGCSHVVMEASSQGFKQFRTHGLVFDYGLFLNIDYDHIGTDEHLDFEEYFMCKRMIFEQSKQMIINKSTPLWDKLTDQEKENAITFSSNGQAHYFACHYAINRTATSLGSRFKLSGKIRDSINLKQMPGLFNCENALAAMAVCHQLQISVKMMKKALENFEVEGRTQLVKEALKFDRTVIIDYAHNSMSMLSLLKALKDYQPRRIICVFGTREDRPKHRRYDIGYAASKYASEIILTEDNPGSQAFETVSAEAVRGISKNHFTALKMIQDRKKAITYALDHASKDDIIVITGKGHEHYQTSNGQAVYFSEQEIILDHLASKKKAKSMAKYYCQKQGGLKVRTIASC
jgi:UDP-N-acetylmuramoyl-L-alanyl-D-glutamate--2,6-diaminopimelate ligase